MSEHPNINLLHSVDVVSKFTNHDKWARVTKQGMDQWKRNQKLALVTASTLYTALGFRGMAEAKMHFHEFILHQEERQFDELTLQRMHHGLDNEVFILFVFPIILKCSTTF